MIVLCFTFVLYNFIVLFLKGNEGIIKSSFCAMSALCHISAPLHVLKVYGNFQKHCDILVMG